MKTIVRTGYNKELQTKTEVVAEDYENQNGGEVTVFCGDKEVEKLYYHHKESKQSAMENACHIAKAWELKVKL